jgi:hypothetical protein
LTFIVGKYNPNKRKAVGIKVGKKYKNFAHITTVERFADL